MNKLDRYKRGDRVKVTFEGVIDMVTTANGVRVKFADDVVWVGARDNKSNDHFHIERIAQPVAVGDMVAWGEGALTWKLVAIEEERGIIVHGFSAASLPLSDLRHADVAK